MERRLWTNQVSNPNMKEDEIIVSLVNEHGHKRWTLIAEEMKKIQPSHRTSKQIRQRWHNHLDPSVNKQPWTAHQERKLFEAHRIYGSKWKQIAAQLEGRTDNYVKNHFYSTLRRSLRRINKYLGSKNSTTQMRMIRPSILSDLLQLSENDSECRVLVSRIFEFASIKPNKATNFELIEEIDREKYHSAITKLIEINQLYTKQNNRKKITKSINLLEIPLIQKECLPITKVKQNEEQVLSISIGSWNEESSLRNHGQLLPELERPEDEEELLDGKEVEKEEEAVEVHVPPNYLLDTITLFNPQL